MDRQRNSGDRMEGEWKTCPVCGSPLRQENYARHLSKVHGGVGAAGREKRELEKAPEGGKRKTLPVAVMISIVVAGALVSGWILLGRTQPAQQPYPTSAKGVWYNSPAIDDGKIGVPFEYIGKNKIVYVDVRFPSEITAEDMLTWANLHKLRGSRREVDILLYVLGAYPKGQRYLPLLYYQTPSGKVVGALRLCEPCGSFDFEIGRGQNLVCQRCGTEWRLENLREIALDKGCGIYPPPELPTIIRDGKIEIDISPLRAVG